MCGYGWNHNWGRPVRTVLDLKKDMTMGKGGGYMSLHMA